MHAPCSPSHLGLVSAPALYLVLLAASASTCLAEECSGTSERFRALDLPSVTTAGTWAILDHDGAGRAVDRYLSSLGEGEGGTGIARSPDFRVATDRMEFTICGHDGVSGGLEKNLVALVDATTGEALRKTPAPSSDPMQPRSWDVRELRGRKVRFEAHDGIAGTAFAWLGVGRIAGDPGLEVDFREGLPSSWTRTSTPRETKTRTVTGGVPFLDHRISVVPRGGATDVPCGFSASRLYFLGCTAFRGRPLEVQGTIEISYREGPPEKYPLMVGFTLELENRLLGRSKAVYLHPTDDAFLYYLVVSPRKGVIETIRLSCAPGADGPPWISGITCETADRAPSLGRLPDCRPSAEEAEWIEAHALSATSPRMDGIEAEIRRAHKLP